MEQPINKKISQLPPLLYPLLSGFTVVVENGVSYQSSLESIKNSIVDETLHNFIDGQLIDNSLIATQEWVNSNKLDITTFSEYTGNTTTIYDGNSPSTVTVGGIPANSILTGKTLVRLFQDMLVPYINPSYTSFSISGQQSLLEVGDTLFGNKTFTWGISTSGNVKPNSINIVDVTNSNTIIVSGLTNDGSEIVDIGTISNLTPMTQQWKSTSENTNDIVFQSSNFTVTSIYPYFWGIVSSGGASSGVNRPVSDQTLIDGGTKVVGVSSGTINITFNSTSDDYIWFAIPSTSTSKIVWYVNALNTGNIGGSVSPGGYLFPNFDTVVIDSPTVLWNGVSYKIYISNYQSSFTTSMQIRNS